MAAGWMLLAALLACCLDWALAGSYCRFSGSIFYQYCAYGCCPYSCCSSPEALAVWIIIVIVVVVILVVSGIITLVCCRIRRRGSRGTVMQPMPMQSGVTVVNAHQGQTAYPAAAGWQQPYTTTPGWQQPQATATGWQQPQASTAGWQQPQATATGWQQPQATATGWQQPQATTAGKQQPQATTAGWQQPGYEDPNEVYEIPTYEESAEYTQLQSHSRENPGFTADSAK